MITFTIQADTPEETRAHIVKWLRDQAINHGVGSRIAERKRVSLEHKCKADAYTAAADFIELIKIEGRPRVFITCEYCGKSHNPEIACPEYINRLSSVPGLGLDEKDAKEPNS